MLIKNWKNALKMHSVQVMLLSLVCSVAMVIMNQTSDTTMYYIMFAVSQIAGIAARLVQQPELEQ